MSDRISQSQWHITTDGSVIKSYPKALDHSDPQRDPPPGRKYLRYTTTRQVGLADLYALDEGLARSNTFFDRLSIVLRVPAWVGLVGVVLLPGVMRRRFERIHVDGGLASSTPEVLKEPEAKALIDTRGTISGSPSGDGR
ncbi:hypothetical protein [Promicromonospora iranensis]|uniref:hypothetical protein n=1 Tax=Promicromonospora iranensis TaxID=1105144 RepID=UPI0023A99BCC|nr:hypothetical protein [Promicromonospora iranensis]